MEASQEIFPGNAGEHLLSASVKEAMDRILPGSATQLLQQHRNSLDDTPLGERVQNGYSNNSGAANRQDQRRDSAVRNEVRENGNVNEQKGLGGHEPSRKKPDAKHRISKADLEIITSLNATESGDEERQGRRSNVERVSRSDSDDVSRPFAALNEKKKLKKKRKHFGKYRSAMQQVLHAKERSNASSDPQAQNLEGSLSTNAAFQNGEDCQNIPGEMHVKTCLSADEVSNNSFSSTKENIDYVVRKLLEHQELPKIRSLRYHLEKHKNRIRNTFPPCYIVIEQISSLLSSPELKTLNLSDSNISQKIVEILPLSARLSHLSKSCAEGNIPGCKRVKRVDPEVRYKNIFEETVLQDSEEDFKTPSRGRSLRKRDKTISYVEPTEADIFAEFSRKRSHSKTKDEEDNNSPEKDKKKRKTTESDDSQNNVAKPITTLVTSSAGQEAVVRSQPSTSLANVRAHTISTLPHPASMMGLFSPQAMQPHFGTPGYSMPHLQAAMLPTSNNTSLSPPSARPQFCMVKMGGKDVLLQVLPPSAPGASPHGSTLLLPGGKRLVVPPNHVLFQQINKAPRISPPSMPMPMLSSIPPPGLANPAPTVLNYSSLAGQAHPTPLVSVVSSSAPTSTYTPITVYPRTTVVNTTASTRRSTRSSAVSSSSSQVPVNYTPVTVYPSTLATTAPPVPSSVVRPIIPMAAPNSTTVARNVRVPGPAGLQAVAPNQATGVRAVRIFVPGCQATGMPGRFATLGSVSNPSTLTRLAASSDLLPQRKENTDNLTAEEKAERRRKLEKKYPLPPGVVIKTESLDPPPSTQSTTPMARSLLNLNNIQLVSAGRGAGGGLQSFRLVNPSSSSGPRGVLVRASSGGRQTILIPSSMGMLTTNMRASVATTSTSVSAAPTVVSSATTAGHISILSTSISCSTTTTTTTTATTSVAQNGVSTTSQPVSLVNSTSLSASSSRPDPALIDKLKKEEASLKKLLETQEAAGLRGERLTKLRELLHQKQKMLKDLTQAPVQPSQPTASGDARNNDDVIVLD